MIVSTVSKKGWVVIPKEHRIRHNLHPGSQVIFVEYGEILAIVPIPQDPLEALHGMFAQGESLTEMLLEARQEDLRREEAPLDA